MIEILREVCASMQISYPVILNFIQIIEANRLKLCQGPDGQIVRGNLKSSLDDQENFDRLICQFFQGIHDADIFQNVPPEDADVMR